MTESVQDTELIAPVAVGGAFTKPLIVSAQEPFILTHADFLHLTGRPPLTETWAMNSFFAVVGYGLSIAPKVMDQWLDQKPGPTPNEWRLFAAGFAVSVMLFVAGKLLPSARRNLLQRIEQHFEQAKVTHHVNGGGQ